MLGTEGGSHLKRFTVSLDDDTYTRLVDEAAAAVPPATLQQMIRYAVDSFLGQTTVVEPEWEDWAEMVAAHRAEMGASDESDLPETEEPYLMDEEEEDAQITRAEAVRTADLSTFRVGGVWFGLSVDKVEGIAARSVIEPLPAGRHGLLGAIRYRQSLIAVFDSATVLGTAPPERVDAHHLVIRHDGALAALAVDEVGNLVHRDAIGWHPVPAGADELTSVGVVAIVDCGDRLVNVLDDLSL
jgi:chemotaxis signal transduction protein